VGAEMAGDAQQLIRTRSVPSPMQIFLVRACG
jgi:hypothetical protein